MHVWFFAWHFGRSCGIELCNWMDVHQVDALLLMLLFRMYVARIYLPPAEQQCGNCETNQLWCAADCSCAFGCA